MNENVRNEAKPNINASEMGLKSHQRVVIESDLRSKHHFVQRYHLRVRHALGEEVIIGNRTELGAEPAAERPASRLTVT